VDLKFLCRVAKLSWSAEGPKLAVEFLVKHGICVICLEHLPHTYLDGAALQLTDGTPVVGLTVRYDRIDNFWFCLLHELAHVGRHLGGTGCEEFTDDLSLRDVEGLRRDPKEDEADDWAQNGLVPDAVWQTSRVRDNPSPLAVMELAQRLEIHPADIAGRVRDARWAIHRLSGGPSSRWTGPVRLQIRVRAQPSVRPPVRRWFPNDERVALAQA
jgi:HTH-type transcriptional regulator / antitoxin HigA